MKNMIMNAAIIILVVANIVTGAINYCNTKPKCMSSDCNRMRVAGSHYCHGHEEMEYERTICLEVISKSSN